MKWLTEIWSVVASLSLRSKTIFVFAVLVLVAGYFFFDRFLDYKENINAKSMTENKMVIEKEPKDKYTEYVLYEDKTKFDTDKKTGKQAK